MNTYTKSILFPAIFLTSVGSFLTGFYIIAEPKSRFLKSIYGLFTGELHGLLLPISITYLMFSENDLFSKNKQIL